MLARTDRWEIALQLDEGGETRLPHRLFHPFSLEANAHRKYEAVLDPATREVNHVRGTTALPAGVSFEFEGGEA